MAGIIVGFDHHHRLILFLLLVRLFLKKAVAFSVKLVGLLGLGLGFGFLGMDLGVEKIKLQQQQQQEMFLDDPDVVERCPNNRYVRLQGV